MTLKKESLKILNELLVAIYKSSCDGFIGLESWSYNSARVRIDDDFLGLINAGLIFDQIPNHEIDAQVRIGEVGVSMPPDFIFHAASFNEKNSHGEHYIDLFQDLKPNGVGIVLLPSLNALREIEKNGLCEAKGLVPSSAIELPENFLAPAFSLRPILATFIKSLEFRAMTFLSYTYLMSELDDYVDIIAEGHRGEIIGDKERLAGYMEVGARDLEYLLNLSSVRFQDDDNLESGVKEVLSCFPGFESWRAFSALDQLISDVTQFPLISLNKLAFSVKTLFKESDPVTYPNAVFLFEGWEKYHFGTLGGTSGEHVVQFLIDTSKVDMDYLEYFLNSRKGKILFAALRNAESLLEKSTDEEGVAIAGKISYPLIPVPALDKQREIVEVSIKLREAKAALSALEDKLSLRPVSQQTEDERNQLDNMLNSVQTSTSVLLSASSPEALEVFTKEETLRHEFKSSIRNPYPIFPESQLENGQIVFHLGDKDFKSKKEIQKFLQHIILKSVSAFLNTHGGSLVIGVHEKDNQKTLVGIEHDEFESQDHHDRHLNQMLTNAFGSSLVSSNIDVVYHEIDGTAFCEVKIEPVSTNRPVFLGEDAHVRTGAAVRTLSGREIASWVENRKV
jgi:hypothetical protein